MCLSHATRTANLDHSSHSPFLTLFKTLKGSPLSSLFHTSLFHPYFKLQMMCENVLSLRRSLTMQSKLSPTKLNVHLPTSALWLAWKGFPSSLSSKFGFLRSLACGLRTASALPSRSDHKNSHHTVLLS